MEDDHTQKAGPIPFNVKWFHFTSEANTPAERFCVSFHLCGWNISLGQRTGLDFYEPPSFLLD